MEGVMWLFNLASFNRTTFNRPFSLDVFFSASMHGKGEISFAPNMEYLMSVHLDGVGTMTMDIIREIFFTAQLDGIGELTIETIRERFMSAYMNGIGEMSVNFAKYHVDTVEYTGDFEPGERIVIDSKKMKFTKDGQNAIHEMLGDFFDLNPGTNELIYTDDESGRSILIRITHRDKYLY
ncbi:MAG TPA: hypothetical protein DCR24_03225 [Bacillus bacterium]|nr:hypothetical protein [Bacillus sp. (in: firmicutes)]